MPTVEQNRQHWNQYYEWPKQGEEWSAVWGGSEAQWFGAILPRIHAFVPTSTILEIAPGFGRWTIYLKKYCEFLAVVDLAEECIKACQQRFASDSHISYYVNDGKSLAMIQDKSIDFVFSFDSLVHAEAEVIEAYLSQLAMKLSPNGIGFIHHSNLGKYQRAFSLIDKIPSEFRELVINRIFLAPTHWRAASMTTELFAEYCDRAGLQCISQELVNWGTDELLIDCFSVFAPKNSIWARPNNVIENKDFIREAGLIKQLSQLYTLKSFQSGRETNSFERHPVGPMPRVSPKDEVGEPGDLVEIDTLERDLALNRVVTDRDCVWLQRQLDTAHRELKRRGEEMKQLSRQWEILLRTIGDLRTKAQAQQKMLEEKTQEIDVAGQQITLLTEERAHYAKQAADFHAALQAERQTLATIYDTVGWKILDRYRRVRESSKLFSLSHKVLTAPVKKLITRRKNAAPISVNQGDGGGPTDVVGEMESQRQWGPVGELVPFEFAEVLDEGGPTAVIGEMESQRQWGPVGELVPFEFTEVREPTVSVVIPVYNHAEFTYRCLQSLCNNSITNSFEVIVVDDCSTDETQELLGRMKGIRVVRNEKNSGFILSCNAGAAAARGKYIWFLNNDTVLTSDSLDALVATFLEFPDAGLVGSKLIYPDGKLQEAGGIIWKDASGSNYGRGDDPDKPEYSYLRDVDWCSGASVMIPNSLFHELGGFDRRYLPAYYEDVDLAFTVRKAGKRVLLQPLSRIVHVEGVSSGTDIREGVKSFQQINKDKFYQKWKDTLTRQGSSSVNPSWKKDRYAKRRILMIDACTPTPDKDAGSNVVSFYMKTFASLSYKTTFIPADNFLYLDPYTRNLQSIGIECLYAPEVVDVESHLRERGSEYDVVILFRLQFAAKYIDVVREHCARAVVIFNPIDLHYLREERQAIVESSAELAQHAKQTKALELETVRKVDGTIVVSETECEILNREIPGANVTTIPILFSVKGNRAPFDERRDVFCLDGYQHKPNLDAVFYFVRSIWPLVKQKLPEAKFYVLDSNVTQEILALATDDVVVVGYVEDLSHYLDRCRMSVVPLRYGADMKGKIGTSMSYGVPCVATSIAVEGLGLKQGENILVGDTPENFAQEVVTLYTDKRLWDHLSISGLSFVKAHWSIKVGERKLTEFLGQLTGTTSC